MPGGWRRAAGPPGSAGPAGRRSRHRHPAPAQLARRPRHDRTVTDDDARAVLAAEDRRYRAMLDADLDALDELCAEELSYAHSNGARDTKAEYVEKIRSGYYVY